MKYFFTLITLLIFSTSCSTSISREGEITNVTGTQTFQAVYKGNDLKVGDKVLILKKVYKYNGVSNERRREIPYKEIKTVVGSGVVLSALSKNFFELKSDKPQHIPEDAIIQKI